MIFSRWSFQFSDIKMKNTHVYFASHKTIHTQINQPKAVVPSSPSQGMLAGSERSSSPAVSGCCTFDHVRHPVGMSCLGSNCWCSDTLGPAWYCPGTTCPGYQGFPCVCRGGSHSRVQSGRVHCVPSGAAQVTLLTFVNLPNNIKAAALHLFVKKRFVLV